MNADDLSAKETPRDNEFTFKMAGISKLAFDMKEHSITEGQPWKGITGYGCNQERCTLTVKAGRKASKEVADWFKKNIGGGSAMGCGSFDKLPQQLNFAFKGTLSFSHQGVVYSGQDVVLAQGHNARSRNNWWVGGANMSQLINWPIPHIGIASQTFTHSGVVPAKVFFSTMLEQISSVDMGFVGL